MIGKGPPKGEQSFFALFFSFEQVVFKLTVFVARNKWMNGIFPFQVEVNTLFSEKGHIYMLIGYVQSKKLTGQVL
mgnify:CR=1 FL=1